MKINKRYIENTLAILLLIFGILNLFMINYTHIIGSVMILLTGGLVYLIKDKRIKIVLGILSLIEFIYVITNFYILYVVAGSALAIISLLYVIFLTLNLKKRYVKIPLLILETLNVFIILLLIVTAISPKPLITFLQSNSFHVTNSYEQKNTTKRIVNENGDLYINDICYGTEYPNSYLDIYIANNNPSVSRPTVIMIHGGGFVWGDKAEGDPNGNTSGTAQYINSFLDEGYNLVSINYVFAPEYLYPTPMYRISQAVEFLQTNGSKYGIDMSKIIFTGGSAGGHLEGQFVNIQTNEAYAKELGITPVLDKESIVAVIFNSALLDNERFGKTGTAIIDYLFTQCGRTYFNCNRLEGNRNVIQSNVIENMTKDFPACYISDGNTGTFNEQAKELYEKTKALGIISYFNFHEKSEVMLFHGYEQDGSESSIDNMKKQIKFLQQLVTNN